MNELLIYFEVLGGTGLICWIFILNLEIRKIKENIVNLKIEMERWENSLKESYRETDGQIKKSVFLLEQKVLEMHGKLFK